MPLCKATLFKILFYFYYFVVFIYKVLAFQVYCKRKSEIDLCTKMLLDTVRECAKEENQLKNFSKIPSQFLSQ